MSRLLLVVPLLLLAACVDQTTPPGDLTGMWTASALESSTVLTLVESGAAIAGTGTYWRFVNPPTGTLKVSGTYDPPTATLELRYDDGRVSTYVGIVRDPDHMAGRETFEGGGTDSLAFVRQ
jgi:hypothetical protein